MIKLATVIGHGIELLPQFIEHYSKYVDEIQIVAYETIQNPDIEYQIRNIIEGKAKVKIIKTIKERIYDWEKVTQLYNFIKSKSPRDWWVVADIDEFHLYPDDDLNVLIENCEFNNWDIVRGGFIDRIGQDGRFIEFNPEESIWEQYPNAGFFRYPMSKANPNKICVMKGHVELTSGQHYAKIDGHTTWRWQGWNHPMINPSAYVQVHHFKWDKTAIERIQDVAKINQEYAYSSEYSTMYNQLKKTNFKINLNDPDFLFEMTDGYAEYFKYKQWNKLVKKIISI